MADAAVAYRGTGKRKTSVARVVLVPGAGVVTVNGRPVEEYFPRQTLRAIATSPLALTGTDAAYDVRARIDGGGISGQAGRAPPRDLEGAHRGRREPAHRPEAAGVPDPRRPPGRAQEGRPEEGPQAAAVLEALTPSP